MHVQPAGDPHPFAAAVLEAAEATGHRRFPNANGKLMEAENGCSFVDEIVIAGRRKSVYRAYLHPKLSQPNVTVITGMVVDRVAVEGRRAAGVECLLDGERHVFRADVEVILSLGAINTPRVMMHSGIGNAECLKALGVSVTGDLPAIGRNLHDHVSFGCVWGGLTRRCTYLIRISGRRRSVPAGREFCQPLRQQVQFVLCHEVSPSRGRQNADGREGILGRCGFWRHRMRTAISWRPQAIGCRGSCGTSRFASGSIAIGIWRSCSGSARRATPSTPHARRTVPSYCPTCRCAASVQAAGQAGGAESPAAEPAGARGVRSGWASNPPPNPAPARRRARIPARRSGCWQRRHGERKERAGASRAIGGRSAQSGLPSGSPGSISTRRRSASLAVHSGGRHFRAVDNFDVVILMYHTSSMS
jgi:hypothetical protein